MNELSIFNYQENEVRTVTVNGEPWFVASDVCDILEIANPRSSLSILDSDEKGVHTMDTPGGNQQLSIVNEPGLYSLILRSRKPEAKTFKRWVTHEVLPTIRKTGGAYLTIQKAEEILHDPNLIIGLAQQVIDLKAKNEQQQKQIEADRPKTIFADAVSVSDTDIPVGMLAKILNQNGIDIGRNRLFERFREDGYMIRQLGREKNMPTQRSMDMGLFRVTEKPLVDPRGNVMITRTVLVTGKGQLYFVNKFIEERDRQRVA